MALQLISQNRIDAGIQVNIGTADSALIAAGVTVSGTGGGLVGTINGSGSAQSVTVLGTVVGDTQWGIQLGAVGRSGNEVVIGANGYVGAFAGYSAIIMAGSSSTVTNRGMIYSSGSAGISISGAETGTTHIYNDGWIKALSAVQVSGAGAASVTNNGTIEGGFSAYLGANGADTFINNGTMRGTVSLGEGADLYDGRLGKAVGTVYGDGGTDTIYGGTESNVIDGGADADTMAGGKGNDRYFVDNAGDKVTEKAGEGTDRVDASVSWTLGSNLENLSLTGREAIDGTGNSVANTIKGNLGANTLRGLDGNDTLDGSGGADRLNGGLGNDKMTGGTNSDIFYFNTALGSTNIDTITDFNVTADTMYLENAVFTKLTATGTLSSGAFKANTTGIASDSTDRIVYETDTGKLFYDADGNKAGGVAGIHFATLANKAAITAADFTVI